jgi:hypothetical protein
MEMEVVKQKLVISALQDQIEGQKRRITELQEENAKLRARALSISKEKEISVLVENGVAEAGGYTSIRNTISRLVLKLTGY